MREEKFQYYSEIDYSKGWRFYSFSGFVCYFYEPNLISAIAEYQCVVWTIRYLEVYRRILYGVKVLFL